jgi:hypothetical protein
MRARARAHTGTQAHRHTGTQAQRHTGTQGQVDLPCDFDDVRQGERRTAPPQQCWADVLMCTSSNCSCDVHLYICLHIVVRCIFTDIN